MKRIIMCLFLVLIITSGCNKISNMKITCTKNNQMEENNVAQKVETNFVDNKLTTANLEIRLIISERYLPYINLLEEQLLNSYNEFNNKDGISFLAIKGESDIKLKIAIDFNKIVEPIESLGLINDQSSSEDVLNTFNNMGYMCVK